MKHRAKCSIVLGYKKSCEKLARVTPCISCFCAPRNSGRVPEAERGETHIKQLRSCLPAFYLHQRELPQAECQLLLRVDSQTRNHNSGTLFVTCFWGFWDSFEAPCFLRAPQETHNFSPGLPEKSTIAGDSFCANLSSPNGGPSSIPTFKE